MQLHLEEDNEDHILDFVSFVDYEFLQITAITNYLHLTTPK